MFNEEVTVFKIKIEILLLAIFKSFQYIAKSKKKEKDKNQALF